MTMMMRMMFVLMPSFLGSQPLICARSRAAQPTRLRRARSCLLHCTCSSHLNIQPAPAAAVPSPFYALQDVIAFPATAAEHRTPLRACDRYWRFLVSSSGTVARHLFILVSRDRHPLRTRLVSCTLLPTGARLNDELIVPSFVRSHVPHPVGWRQVLITSAPALAMRLPGETLFSVASWWSQDVLQHARFDDPEPTLLPPLWEAIDTHGRRPLVFSVHQILYGKLPLDLFGTEWDDYAELGTGPRGSNALSWQRPGYEYGWGRICLYQKQRTIVGVTYEIFSRALEKYFID
ncbi:hypothetical protein F1559_002442 [Cyanidiococcus yangmingshanensis]|uniref:Uncharacterized protein n=1 Tax=Cyanidiococcus yangmingshanensis TaxID=2690220 RepID=A0A7J7ID95_9RHOD|nr:hypothetical protein F1559_002442 [Cyanidiococcus yangmingshanensis]